MPAELKGNVEATSFSQSVEPETESELCTRLLDSARGNANIFPRDYPRFTRRTCGISIIGNIGLSEAQDLKQYGAIVFRGFEISKDKTTFGEVR